MADLSNKLFVEWGIQNTALLAMIAKFIWDLKGKFIKMSDDIDYIKVDIGRNEKKIGELKEETEKIEDRVFEVEKTQIEHFSIITELRDKFRRNDSGSSTEKRT